jgi:hypothetical protein
VPRWYDVVASPCHLFSRDHDHVVETSRADRYRAPCGNSWIAPLVPTSVGWDDHCVPLGYKKEKAFRGVANAKSRLLSSSTVSPLLFFLQLVLANQLLAQLRCCSTHSLNKLVSRLRRPPLEEARRRPKEESRLHRRPCPSSSRCSSPSARRF